MHTHLPLINDWQLNAGRDSSVNIVLIHRRTFRFQTKFTIAVYGNDQGANNVLDAVAGAAHAHDDIDVVRFPGLNTAIPDDLHDRLQESCAAVLGISTGMPEARIAAQALRKNPALAGKIFFVQDFPGSSGIHDPVLRSIGKDARLCSILLLPQEAAERAVYRSVHAVGVPDHWFFALKAIREGMRLRSAGKISKRRQGTGEEVAIDARDLVVYVSGSKDPVREARLLRHLRELKSIDGRPVLFHFRAHPSERNLLFLREAIRERDALLDGQWQMVMPEEEGDACADAWLIGASDIAIVHPGSTSVILASALRKKLIGFDEGMPSSGGGGSSFGYVQTTRLTHHVRRVSDIELALSALSREQSKESVGLRERQERYALTIEKGGSYGKNVLVVVRRFICDEAMRQDDTRNARIT